MLNIHETVYKLSADPFRLSPDHHFAYSHRSYARSKAYLDYALLQGEGFVMITGAPGTGKTTLIKEILANIDITSIQVATLTSTQLRTRDLLQMVATAFNLRFEDADKATLLTALEQFLRQQCQGRRRVVLIVDEAQGLSISALEELRLLANLQHDNQMLLQVFLLGQEKLRDLISSPGMEQLRQRVVASSHLEPLDLDDTVSYVQYRLSQAGWQGDPEIESEALQLIHKYSGGIPRLINLICTRLLLSGGMSDKHILDGQDAQDVILELQQETLIDPDKTDLPVADPLNTRSPVPPIRNIVPEEECAEEDRSIRHSTSMDSKEQAADVVGAHRSSTPNPARDKRKRKITHHNSTSKRNARKRSKDHKQKSVASATRDEETALEDDAARQRDEMAQVPPPKENKIGRRIGRTGRDSPVASRSISMAAARAAPLSRGLKPDDSQVHITTELGSPAKSSASSLEQNDRKPAIQDTKRKGKSLTIKLIIFLLVVGPLAAVVGVNFRDHMITVSAQVDKNGMVRSLMPSINNVDDNSGEFVVNVSTDKTSLDKDK
jgi:putative secretion ATPase (PEP-CTERM system associated)